jgi:hypothetical protein
MIRQPTTLQAKNSANSLERILTELPPKWKWTTTNPNFFKKRLSGLQDLRSTASSSYRPLSNHMHLVGVLRLLSFVLDYHPVEDTFGSFPCKEHFVDNGFEDFCRRLQLKTERHARNTPVFTCPYPLLGCRYQTLSMEDWKRT